MLGMEVGVGLSRKFHFQAAGRRPKPREGKADVWTKGERGEYERWDSYKRGG